MSFVVILWDVPGPPELDWFEPGGEPMESDIHVGCVSEFGQGGLGYHLEFVYRAAEQKMGKPPFVYCTGKGPVSGFRDIPPPRGWRLLGYTPMRWLPAVGVYGRGRQFDRVVSRQMPSSPIV